MKQSAAIPEPPAAPAHNEIVAAADGERQIVTVPLHKPLATCTLHAIYRRTARFVPSIDLRRAFFAD